MKKLILVGAGNFSDVVHAYFERYSDYQVVAYSCDKEANMPNTYHGLPLIDLANLEQFYSPKDVHIFVAIGYSKVNSVKKRVFEELKLKGYSFASFVHPEVDVWENTEIGDNVFIFEDNTIQPFTSIGDNTTLWSGNHLGHHSKIGKHCFISSHVVISGSCDIHDQVFIGVNATLRDGLTIANKTVIGAGTLIMKDTNVEDVYMIKGTQPSRVKSSKLGS